MKKVNIFWFRRDLRIQDNHGLEQALRVGNVLPIFIFDPEILNKLSNKKDKRVNFIYKEIKKLKYELENHSSSLIIFFDKPLNAFKRLYKTYQIQSVFLNHDYEPYAIKRDQEIKNYLNSEGIGFHSFKDQVVFEKLEITKKDSKPYTVFTPYKRKWIERLNETGIQEFRSESLLSGLSKTKPFSLYEITELGFEKTDMIVPKKDFNLKIISEYDKNRDFPSVNGTSRLSVHLRFGTISIRQLVKTALKLNQVYLNELIWREFYMMILWNFPYVVDQSFKKKYDQLEWRNNENEFNAWCNGLTGYPIVDAGMRELTETGYMHNRLRMITASFLTKHLLIDWRWGEAYFAEKLLDYELSSNNGGWQWAASTGCDAVPYFRIFNPLMQTKRFDSGNHYIRKWVPEYDTLDYPQPIVDHKYARERALNAYKNINKL
ncbi:MAG: deoxyribodipyrimidine photolyase [Marinilabiliales bacterium]|nr:MAG: deoxyribodipyrimidine photolyase [Marinilabiliales bacterium]